MSEKRQIPITAVLPVVASLLVRLGLYFGNWLACLLVGLLYFFIACLVGLLACLLDSLARALARSFAELASLARTELDLLWHLFVQLSLLDLAALSNSLNLVFE